MRIAVTGVSGFLGSYLVRHLKAAGHRVTGLVRATSRRDHIASSVDRFVVGEQADESRWSQLLEDADCIIHNSVSWEPAPDDSAQALDLHLRSNILGSIKLLRFSAPRQYIYISSIAVHHDMRPSWGGLIDEDHPLRPNHLYGAYKAAVEAHLWAEHYAEGRHACAIRPCGVYGIDPDLPRSHGYDLLLQLTSGEPIRKPGGGKWVPIDDTVAAIAGAIGNPAAAGRPFNLVGCYLRHADWAALGAEVLGVKADIDFSSPAQPQNTFTKEAAGALGVTLDRGREGIREHLRALAAEMRRRGVLKR